ncbi:hypothetical protein [Streptomyces sp. NPDC026092]|uniref:hypothetical protein n=1 Tax=Streptomyces sp. NPDC026092 TaxID=3154797 RepID=UPI0033F2B088
MTGVDVSGPSQDMSRGLYFGFTLAVVVLGWIIAGAIAGVSYLASGLEAIPIMIGFVACCAHAVVLRLLHCAWWLAFLSFLPGLFVLVGSVEYPVEAALGSRGDPGGQLQVLALGLVGWAGITLLAGWRGFVRRRAGRRPAFDEA